MSSKIRSPFWRQFTSSYSCQIVRISASSVSRWIVCLQTPSRATIVPDADLLADPSFAVHLCKTEEYPVLWEVKKMEKMQFEGMSEKSGVAYIMKRKANTWGGESAIGELFARDFLIRAPLFADARDREVNSIVRVTARRLATARIYPVEPPLGPPEPPDSEGLQQILDDQYNLESLKMINWNDSTPKQIPKKYTVLTV
ncbi:hypothetical protein PENTCL1PPCAC_19246, partial [Pristionchus entomophagus]